MLLVLKIGITISLCIWLFSKIDIPALTSGFQRVGLLTLAFALFLQILIILLTATRWWILLPRSKHEVPFIRIFPSYYLGAFLNNFLPTSFGGDAGRIFHLRNSGLSLNILVSSSVVDRAVGLATIFSVGILGLLLSSKIFIPDTSKIILIGCFFFGIMLAGWLLSVRGGYFLETLEKKYSHTRVRGWFLKVLRDCYSYRENWISLLLAVLLSLSAYALVILSYYLIGVGLGLDISMYTYLVTIPAIFLASSLPISFGGLGVREGTLVAVLISVGTDLTQAIILSLLYLVTFWCSTLPGALVLLMGKNKKLVIS